MLTALLLAAVGLVVPGADDAAAATPERAEILMPFDGVWANDFGTDPATHNRGSYDWAMDIYAVGADVAIGIGAATGSVTLVVTDVVLDATCGGTGGWYVRLDVVVDGLEVGSVLYHHLKAVAVTEGQVVAPGTVLGRTVHSPTALSGPCWHVSTPMGIHTHVAFVNAQGSSCFVPYTIGQQLDADQPIAVLGANADGSSVGTGPRSECGRAPVLCAGQPATIVGTDGADELIGTAGPDVIVGLGGNDVIHGGGGADVICGGRGADHIQAGPGNDLVMGGLVGDTVHGGGGHDTIRAGKGDDTVDGGPGDDLIEGFAGDDVLTGGLGDDLVRGHGGHDQLRGVGGADRLWSGTGDDRLWGGPGSDELAAKAGTDRCHGGGGTDTASSCEAVLAVP